MTLPGSTIYNYQLPCIQIMSRIPEKKKILLYFLLAGIFLSCDSKRVYEEYMAVDKGIWNVNKKAGFNVVINDIISRYNIYLNVRNAPDYGYSNLFLFLNTTYPDGRVARDIWHSNRGHCRSSDRSRRG